MIVTLFIRALGKLMGENMRLVLIIFLSMACIPTFSAQISVNSNSIIIDSDIFLQVRDAKEGQRYKVTAQTHDKNGQIWTSWAEFYANADGSIDFNSKPINGSYSIAHSQGLWWSMKPKGVTNEEKLLRSFLIPDSEFETTVSLQNNNGIVLDSASFIRFTTPKNLKVETFRSHAMYGDLYYLKDSSHQTTIITLGGSEGGLSTGTAKLLAAKGFTVLALAYHGIDPLPAKLNNVPLEYGLYAARFLENHSAVDPNKIIVFGTSKGGEFALALASFFPDKFAGAIARVPSGISWQGLGAKGEQLPQTSTWTLKGHPLPYLPIIYKKEDFLSPPYRVSKGYLRGLSYLKSIPNSEFPVEKIQGPILLISGTDDHVWPSSIMSNMVQDRLEKYNFSYPVKHLRYENAGHFIGLPNLPTTGKIFGSMSAGGNQQDDAIASHDSWNSIIKFLENI